MRPPRRLIRLECAPPIYFLDVFPQYSPMVPTQVRQPFHRPGWVYEEKVDGWRMLAYKDGARVRLLSRTNVEHTRRFPELAAAIARLRPTTLVLDGEVTVFDAQLRSRFDQLRHPDPDIVTTPPVYIAFDLLYRAGKGDRKSTRLNSSHSQISYAVFCL